MNSSSSQFYENTTYLQKRFHQIESEAMIWDDNLTARSGGSKSKLELQNYWETVIHNGALQQKRNDHILAKLGKVEDHLASLSSKTEALGKLKVQYSEALTILQGLGRPNFSNIHQANLTEATNNTLYEVLDSGFKSQSQYLREKEGQSTQSRSISVQTEISGFCDQCTRKYNSEAIKNVEETNDFTKSLKEALNWSVDDEMFRRKIYTTGEHHISEAQNNQQPATSGISSNPVNKKFEKRQEAWSDFLNQSSDPGDSPIQGVGHDLRASEGHMSLNISRLEASEPKVAVIDNSEDNITIENPPIHKENIQLQDINDSVDHNFNESNPHNWDEGNSLNPNVLTSFGAGPVSSDVSLLLETVEDSIVSPAKFKEIEAIPKQIENPNDIMLQSPLKPKESPMLSVSKNINEASDVSSSSAEDGDESTNTESDEQDARIKPHGDAYKAFLQGTLPSTSNQNKSDSDDDLEAMFAISVMSKSNESSACGSLKESVHPGLPKSKGNPNMHSGTNTKEEKVNKITKEEKVISAAERRRIQQKMMKLGKDSESDSEVLPHNAKMKPEETDSDLDFYG